MIQVQYSGLIILLWLWLLQINCYELLSEDDDSVYIRCDKNGLEPLNESSINEPIYYPSYIVFYRCPQPKKPYLEELKEINVNASRVSEISYKEMVDSVLLTEYMLQGLPLRKVDFDFGYIRPYYYEVLFNPTENLDLANKDTYVISCRGEDDSLNKRAALPNTLINVPHIVILNCSSPNVSYFDILQNINVNYTSVQFLTLQMINLESVPLNSGHFKGLSLRALEVVYPPSALYDYYNKLDPEIFEVVTADAVILRRVRLKTLPKWRIKHATLEYGTFDGEWGDCSMLTSLQLIKFSVSAIPGGWLRNCHNLTELTLNGLNLDKINLTSMGAHVLKKLIIKDCSSNLITPFAVDAVHNLRMLKIVDSSIESSVDTFSALKRLEELELVDNDWNGLSILRAMVPLGNLRQLTIKENAMELFCKDFPQYKLQMTQAPAPHNNFVPGVERLYLPNSELSSICFQDWHNLTYLDLSHNRISELQMEGLPVPRNRPLTVNLTGNPIKLLPSTVDIEKFRGSQNITILLNLTVDCDCDIRHLAFVKALHELPQISLLNDACSSGVRLVDFSGTHKYSCGNCTCHTSCPDGATVANCNARRLYAFPEVWSSLDETSQLRKMTFLEKILAPNNIIEKLPEFTYPESLIEVDLSNNKITRISGSALDALFSVGNRRVRLSRNPLVCECDTQDMLDMLSRNQNQIPDYKNLTCSYYNEDTFLHELQDHSLCTVRALVAFGIVGASLLALAAIAAVLRGRIQIF